MKKLIVYLWIVIFICGCSPQLRTLISLSNEQKTQKVYLESQRRNFKLLLNNIKHSKIKLGIKKEEIINLYGEPITIKNINEQVVFLYRGPVDFLPSEKVYLYFDRQDALINFEIITKASENKTIQ